jgi:hypothetical protein
MKLTAGQLRGIIQETVNEAASPDTWDKAASTSQKVVQDLAELEANLRYIPGVDTALLTSVQHCLTRMERTAKRIAGAAAGASPNLKL